VERAGYVYLWKRSASRVTREDGGPSLSCVAAFPAHRGAVRALIAESPKTLLSAGFDGQVCVLMFAATMGRQTLTAWLAPPCFHACVLEQVRRWDVSSLDKPTEAKAWSPCAAQRGGAAITTHVEGSKDPFPKDPNLRSLSSLLREANVTSVKIADMCLVGPSSVAVGLRSGRVGVLDLRTGAEVEVVRAHHGVLMGLATHPTQPDVFATAGEDGLLLLVDRGRRRVAAHAVLPAKAHSVAFSPDGEHVAVGFDGGALAVYQTRGLSQVGAVDAWCCCCS
jgi:WD40 repeat protein